MLLPDLWQGMTARTSGEFATTLGVDVLDASEIRRVADSTLGGLARFAQICGVIFGAGLLLSLSLAAFERRLGVMLIVAAACLLFCASRIGIFALLDASSWNGAQARYMMPLLPLLGLSGALGLANLMDRVRAASRRRTAVASGQGETSASLEST